jgi:hypothetical protein
VWGVQHDRVGGERNVFDDNGFIVKEKIKPPNWPRHTSARHRRRHISRRSSPTPAERPVGIRGTTFNLSFN